MEEKLPRSGDRGRGRPETTNALHWSVIVGAFAFSPATQNITISTWLHGNKPEAILLY
ncbi:uncharacterized protein G2W53_021708 [Senna tora]|uniref:Uncharacterized protein n=1 Tax=Senna tora TaxID=362788 RepID=A0A834WNM5_9FABA|nr:uncharacterized protein G2W53_021708 [Senna tora]